ncbi:MAG: FMN-binding negative transcriptional regulator [bacterium]|nr:FMN-binding negative transcriptional regulator [bacterium]
MYNISHFKEPEQSRIRDLIKKYPFAFLTGSLADGKQVATQVPLLLIENEDDLLIQGHIMRSTDHHKAFLENANALAVFSGPHSYVSARWYSTQNVGSTWNYMSVHISGKVRFMDDQELVDFMKRLTLHFENDDSNSPTFYDNLSESYLEKMMKAIVGFEIKGEKIDHVFKLSQNKDEESYDTIITELEHRGGQSTLIATEMKKRRGELF